MSESFEIKAIFKATSVDVYKHWLDGEKHSLMTGGKAFSAGFEGEGFKAWDGYISGKHLKLVPHSKIIQTWRTTEFGDDDEDSLVEIHLQDTKMGCEVKLIHSKIPSNQPDYKQGWYDYYFTPMKEYFENI